MASKNQEIAQNFVDKCKEFGFQFSIRGSVISVKKQIKPNSNQDFSMAENQSGSLLCIVPTTKPSSMWGTDGGSIGGVSAIQTGNFVMNKSGCSVRVINAIKKLQY